MAPRQLLLALTTCLLAAQRAPADDEDAAAAVARLKAAVENESQQAVLAAADVVVKLKAESAAILALQPALESEIPADRGLACIALGKFQRSHDAVLPMLLPRFVDAEEAVAQSAAMGAGSLGKPALPRLLRGLADDNPRVRRWSAFALGEMRGEAREAVADLAERIDDTDEQVRAEVLGALGGIGPEAKPALPEVTEALKDKAAHVRETAAAALWYIDRQAAAATPVLVKGLADPENDAVDRQAIMQVLGDIGANADGAIATMQVVPALAPWLRDRDPLMRYNALVALKALGPRAGAAADEIRKLKDDEIADIRTAAAEALQAVER